jgi:hypothetical protein
MKKVTISLDELIGEVEDKTEHKKSNAERREELIEILFEYLKKITEEASKYQTMKESETAPEIARILANLLA